MSVLDMGTQGGEFLDDDELDQLAAVVVASDAASAAHRDAFAKIIDSVARLVAGEVDDAERRFSGRGGRQVDVERDDLEALALTAVVAAVTGWEPDQGRVFHRIQWAVRDELAKDPRDRHLHRSWARTGRIAWAVRGDMSLALGRTPTMSELHKVVEERCRAWQHERLSDDELAGTRAQQQAAVDARLVKSGTTGALANLDEVMLATGSIEHLDAGVGDDGEALGLRLPDAHSDVESILFSPGADPATSIRCAFGDLDGDQRTAVEDALLLVGAGEAPSLKQAAERVGLERSVLVAAVKRAKARAAAPHAQFAYFYDGLEARFEDPVGDDTAALITQRVAAVS